MNEQISASEQLEEVLMSLKYMDFIPAVDDPLFEKILKPLADYIDQLIQTNFNKLLAILYRIDVSEDKIKGKLHANRGVQSPGRIIAVLILERQMEKLKWRKMYSSSSSL